MAARPQLLPFLGLLAWALLNGAPAAFTGARWPGLRRFLRPLAAAAPGAPGSALDTLLDAAATASDEELLDRVDKEFGSLTPDDMSALRVRLESADEAGREPLTALLRCVQAAMEKRMAQATEDLSNLLQSSGDIGENIKECLAKQDSPLPILAVLQMNLEKAKKDGVETQERALSFILRKIDEELQAKIPVANRVLSVLIQTTDSDERRNYLRAHLAQVTTEKGEKAAPSEIAKCLVDLVNNVVERYQDGAGAAGETREQALTSIKEVAFDVALVVEEVLGEDEQSAFTEQLLPLFEALNEEEG